MAAFAREIIRMLSIKSRKRNRQMAHCRHTLTRQWGRGSVDRRPLGAIGEEAARQPFGSFSAHFAAKFILIRAYLLPLGLAKPMHFTAFTHWSLPPRSANDGAPQIRDGLSLRMRHYPAHLSGDASVRRFR